MDDETGKNLHTISFLPVFRDTSPASPPNPEKAKQVAILLAKLAVHYYRPDFTEAAAQSLIGDMVEDLHKFPIVDTEQAIKQYRRDPKNRFFPNSGQLIAILRPEGSEPRRRLPQYDPTDYEVTGPLATKSAAQVLAEHGLAVPWDGKNALPPLPGATDPNGPVTDALRGSRLVRSVLKGNAAKARATS